MKTRERRQKIIELLRESKVAVSAVKISGLFGTTERTVYRDVDALRQQGEPVIAERGRKGGFRLAERTGAGSGQRPSSQVSADSSANGEYVGRQLELERLLGLLDAAGSGRGGMAMLTGEPGIGKTRTAQEVSDRARLSGFRVLWGRCLESEGVPAFWPWAQIIRVHAAEVGQSQIIEEMGEGAADIATFVSDIREILPGYEAPAPLEYPAPARFRIYESINRFLRASSENAPMLIVIDDLQWADGPSLAVLEFIATELLRSQILLLGTYRDDEVNRRDPLYSTLGELTRLVQPERIHLRGLTKPEVARYLQVMTNVVHRGSVASKLHEQTNGNPLFLSEIVRLLDDNRVERSVTIEGEHLLARVPEGVREVIGRRLDRLSETCNEVLAVAAVISREFEVSILVNACQIPEIALYDSLAEAEQARLIEPVPGRFGDYRFSHPLVRETLYDELSTLARADTHRDVGEAIEQVKANRIDSYLPQLAHHFFESSRSGQAAKAVEYCERASQQAMRQLAPDEAASLCQMSLQALQLMDERDTDTECQLLVALGNALRDAGEFVQAKKIFKSAARVATQVGSPEYLARASIGLEETTWRPGWPGNDAADLLQSAIEALPDDDSELRSRCLAGFSRALVFSGRREEATQVWKDAVSMARRIDDPLTLSFALHTRLYDRWFDGLDDRVEIATEVIEISQKMEDWDRVVQAAAYRLSDLMGLGKYRESNEYFPTFRELARRARHPFNEYVTIGMETILAIFYGRFEEAENLAKKALADGNRLKGLDTFGVFGLQMFTIRRWQGRLAEFGSIVHRFLDDNESNAWRPGLALIYSEIGMTVEAREQFELLAEDEFAKIPHDSMWVGTMSYMADVCAYLGDADRARVLYDLMKRYSDTNVVIGMPPIGLGSMHTYLGIAAETMGDRDRAVRHHIAAVDKNKEMGGSPLIARSEVELASLLVQSNDATDRTKGNELLDEASQTADRLGMAKLLEMIDSLKATAESAPRSYPLGLTQRELEVLRLIADGVANRVIADRLFITQNTVANHVKSILAKTDSANRTEAAALAIRAGLLSANPE